MVIVFIGHVPRSEIFKEYITRDKENFICVNPKTYETNILGIFACGDATNLSGPNLQAGIAAGAGQVAGFNCGEQLIAN